MTTAAASITIFAKTPASRSPSRATAEEHQREIPNAIRPAVPISSAGLFLQAGILASTITKKKAPLPIERRLFLKTDRVS
jgi:hypothetical protein